jgi:hypothetical protein
MVRRQNMHLNSSGMLLRLGIVHYTESSVTGKRIFLISLNPGIVGLCGQGFGQGIAVPLGGKSLPDVPGHPPASSPNQAITSAQSMS